MTIYSITETTLSPHCTFIQTEVTHAGTDRKAAVAAFGAIVDREVPTAKKVFEQPHRTVLTKGGNSKLIITFHVNA